MSSVKKTSIKHIKYLTSRFAFPTFLALFSIQAQATSSCSQLYEQKDFNAAVQQCTEDAKHNLPSADFILGNLYENGYGVEKNTNKALSFYRRALLNNNVDSQIALGKYHTKNKNYLPSYVYFSLAVSNGSLNALLLQDKIAKNLTAQEIEQSNELLELLNNAIANERQQVAAN